MHQQSCADRTCGSSPEASSCPEISVSATPKRSPQTHPFDPVSRLVALTAAPIASSQKNRPRCRRPAYRWTDSGNAIQRADTTELKSALATRALAFCQWLFPAGRRHGGNFAVGSLAGEAGKSLSVCLTGAKAGIWKDFATGEGGSNLLEMLRAQRGGTFAAACREARGWLNWPEALGAGQSSRLLQAPNSHPCDPETPYVLSASQRRWGAAMAKRLIDHPMACRCIAKRRRWQTETVRGLALEASLGLSGANRLAFLYDTGAKQRWVADGERRIIHLYGKADSLWRGGLLLVADTVIICEGEIDAISLIDAGAEALYSDLLVVAVPGARICKPHWAGQLAGKKVLLCFDADDPGREGSAKLQSLLAPHVASLQNIHLEALLK